MIIKRFSATHILNTDSPGFIKGRKYDTDLSRLGKLDTSREMISELGNLNYQKEINNSLQETKKELSEENNLGDELKKLDKQFK